jgi:hypothetical protein
MEESKFGQRGVMTDCVPTSDGVLNSVNWQVNTYIKLRAFKNVFYKYGNVKSHLEILVNFCPVICFEATNLHEKRPLRPRL